MSRHFYLHFNTDSNLINLKLNYSNHLNLRHALTSDSILKCILKEIILIYYIQISPIKLLIFK